MTSAPLPGTIRVYRRVIIKSSKRRDRRLDLQFAPECHDDRADDQKERHSVVPAKPLAKIQPGKNDEYGQGDALLNYFELISGELAIARRLAGT